MKFLYIILLLFTISCHSSSNILPYIKQGDHIKFVSYLPKKFNKPLQKAIKDWNTDKISDDGNIEVPIKLYIDPNDTREAYTQMWWYTNNLQIVKIEIYVNEANVHGVDLESLFIHEIGHCLGYRHSNNYKSVMYPRLLPGQIRRKIIL